MPRRRRQILNGQLESVRNVPAGSTQHGRGQRPTFRTRFSRDTEAVQGDHLGALIEKQIDGMLEGLTRRLNEAITKTLEQFAPWPRFPATRPRAIPRRSSVTGSSTWPSAAPMVWAEG
jgi:hypothetical protein